MQKTKEQLSAHASMMAKARYAKMTSEQRSEHARKMAQARWNKKLSTVDNLQTKTEGI